MAKNGIEELVLVTGNKGKAKEFEELLGIKVVPIKVPVPEIQGIDVIEVALPKAEAAYRQIGKPLIVDDTGISFSAWQGLPGALTSWFLNSVGNEGLLSMLSAFEDRQAVVTTALAYHDGRSVRVFKGEVIGAVATEARGDQGFGYDSVFVPNGFSKTFAEMSPAEKNQFSMRKLAAEELVAFLNGNS